MTCARISASLPQAAAGSEDPSRESHDSVAVAARGQPSRFSFCLLPHLEPSSPSEGGEREESLSPWPAPRCQDPPPPPPPPHPATLSLSNFLLALESQPGSGTGKCSGDKTKQRDVSPCGRNLACGKPGRAGMPAGWEETKPTSWGGGVVVEGRVA